MTQAKPDAPAAVSSPRYFNRDLSWLRFSERVLAQTEDERFPLLERVKFCAIFASNLDEFFMKRVGLAKRRLENPGAKSPDGVPISELLASMRRVVIGHIERLTNVWEDDLKPRLEGEGIRIVRHDALGATDRKAIDAWFNANVLPILTPLAVDPSHRFPFISNLSENFGLLLRRAKDPSAAHVFARVKIPGVVPRFLRLESLAWPNGSGDESTHTMVALDDLIAHNLGRLFPGMAIEMVAPFRVTRSAAVVEDDEDDPHDVLEHVEDELRRRRFADPVRLEAPPEAPSDVLDVIRTRLELVEDDVYYRSGPLEYRDLFEIVSLPRPDLKHETWRAPTPARLRGLAPLHRLNEPGVEDEPGESIFDRIREGDILVHHPYDSFEHSTERFIAEAATDPDVLAIKQTIYRTSPDSPFVRSLARAAEDGKNVACLVELRARFDEERNVNFARQLELAGVHVAYGVVGLKTHCKLSLVVRREPGGLRAYAHIGTGNYHPHTAQLYTDLGLLTCDPALTHDAMAVFNTLTGHAAEPNFDMLLVAPATMRPRFLDMINAEADAARAGQPSRIVCKMNQLEDRQTIDALYEASNAGVDVTLYVRGFCTLRPGVAGMSENIRVVSIVGRFLEHARIFHFASGESDPLRGRYFIGSADWMSRNLSDRVEVAAPVTDPKAKAKLWRILEVMRQDGRNAWTLGEDGSYERIEAPADADPEGPGVIGTFRTLMAEALRAERK
ncbi:MAG: polyphosphate kinase 1 [Phycisphaerae bacterium]|nr:polyphosphate kinase 1 [Phycisphaerae bacterium]